MKKYLLALFLISAALPAEAATHYDVTYKITLWGMRVGDVHYRITLDGDKYAMKFSGGFGGIVGMFAEADGEATVKGQIVKGIMRPQRMDQVTFWGKKRRDVFIEFDTKGNVTNYGATPEYSLDGRTPITPDMLKGVRDHVSAMVYSTAAGEVCGQTIRVFDVRERYDLVMDKTDIANKCRVTPVQVGGQRIDDSDAQNSAEPFNMTFTTIADGKLAVPQKTVKPFTLGSAIIKLAKVDVTTD